MTLTGPTNLVSNAESAVYYTLGLSEFCMKLERLLMTQLHSPLLH